MSDDRPLRLFTWTFRHPVYRHDSVLDCAAIDQEAAFASAVRFIDRENRRLRRAGKVRGKVRGKFIRVQPPRHPSAMREVTAP